MCVERRVRAGRRGRWGGGGGVCVREERGGRGGGGGGGGRGRGGRRGGVRGRGWGGGECVWRGRGREGGERRGRRRGRGDGEGGVHGWVVVVVGGWVDGWVRKGGEGRERGGGYPLSTQAFAQHTETSPEVVSQENLNSCTPQATQTPTSVCTYQGSQRSRLPEDSKILYASGDTQTQNGGLPDTRSTQTKFQNSKCEQRGQENHESEPVVEKTSESHTVLEAASRKYYTRVQPGDAPKDSPVYQGNA